MGREAGCRRRRPGSERYIYISTALPGASLVPQVEWESSGPRSGHGLQNAPACVFVIVKKSAAAHTLVIISLLLQRCCCGVVVVVVVV
jgi:hypothetical protein